MPEWLYEAATKACAHRSFNEFARMAIYEKLVNDGHISESEAGQ